jgi:hypothetical protein
MKHPMDYQTIIKNLGRKDASMEEFADDLGLAYSNGRKFNVTGPDITGLIDSRGATEQGAAGNAHARASLLY